MKAKARRPARFDLWYRSSVFGQTVRWKVLVSQSGFEAVRDVDGSKVAIEWRTLISAALFYGGNGNGKV